MRHIIVPICLALAACTPGPGPDDLPSRAAAPIEAALPVMRTFPAPARPTPLPERSNRDVARDFMDLAFRLESGRTLQRFTRFEGPVRVAVAGAPPATLIPDLDRLLQRLRAEAGIDITRTEAGRGDITIEAVPRARIRRTLAQAACFVVPNISRLSEYPAARQSGATRWSALHRRTRIAIFLPGDASPQEVRDCLHEELAQALGPLNDLYRLPESVFNDDNMHSVLTGFDMLILRVHYAPELRTGISRGAVAARLPAILKRLNPAGERIRPRPAPATPPAWRRAIRGALGPEASPRQRRAAAAQALSLAREAGLTDHRLGFSHFVLARVIVASDPALAERHLRRADAIFAQVPGTGPHRAFVATQLAGFALARGDGADSLDLLTPHVATARRHENAALLATLKMMQAEALEMTGRARAARALRLDSLGWARYGFGSDLRLRTPARALSILGPAGGSTTRGR